MEITVNISKGDAARLERVKELRKWKDNITMDEMISRCIGFAWIAAENKNRVNQ